MQRLSGSDITAGELSFSGASAPNLAFSVPLARLRLWQQRRERADAAAARAATSGALHVTANPEKLSKPSASCALKVVVLSFSFQAHVSSR